MSFRCQPWHHNVGRRPPEPHTARNRPQLRFPGIRHLPLRPLRFAEAPAMVLRSASDAGQHSPKSTRTNSSASQNNENQGRFPKCTAYIEYRSIYIYIHFLIYLFNIYLSVYLSIDLSIYLSVYLIIYTVCE